MLSLENVFWLLRVSFTSLRLSHYLALVNSSAEVNELVLLQKI